MHSVCPTVQYFLDPVSGVQEGINFDFVRIWLQASLALTEQQRAYLAQLRSVCLTALAGIIDERNAIHANLTVRVCYLHAGLCLQSQSFFRARPRL